MKTYEFKPARFMLELDEKTRTWIEFSGSRYLIGRFMDGNFRYWKMNEQQWVQREPSIFGSRSKRMKQRPSFMNRDTARREIRRLVAIELRRQQLELHRSATEEK